MRCRPWRQDRGARIDRFALSDLRNWQAGNDSESRSTNTREDFLAKVKERVVRTGRGKWITGRGWIETFWKPPRFPTRHDLDEIAPGSPVLLTRADGHAAIEIGLGWCEIQNAGSRADDIKIIRKCFDEAKVKLRFINAVFGPGEVPGLLRLGRHASPMRNTNTRRDTRVGGRIVQCDRHPSRDIRRFFLHNCGSRSFHCHDTKRSQD